MTTADVEMKPAGPLVSEVFLSPRVLDRQAFDVLSEALRALIEQAATQSAQLALVAGRAEEAQRRLHEQAQQVEGRVASAQGSMQLVAAQAEEAKRAMHAVEEAGLRLRTLEMATQRGIEDAQRRLAQLEAGSASRLTEALAEVTERVSALESRIDAAEARLRALSSDGAVQLLRALCERAERLLQPGSGASSLGEMVKRGEALVGWTRGAITDLDQLRGLSEAVRRELGASVLEAAAAADQIRAGS